MGIHICMYLHMYIYIYIYIYTYIHLYAFGPMATNLCAVHSCASVLTVPANYLTSAMNVVFRCVALALRNRSPDQSKPACTHIHTDMHTHIWTYIHYIKTCMHACMHYPGIAFPGYLGAASSSRIVIAGMRGSRVVSSKPIGTSKPKANHVACCTVAVFVILLSR